MCFASNELLDKYLALFIASFTTEIVVIIIKFMILGDLFRKTNAFPKQHTS